MSHKNEYETICVFSPDLTAEKIKTIQDKITKVFSNHKIEGVKTNDWGNRKLAYAIQKYKTGHYMQYVYQVDNDPKFISDLEKNLGYEESILRYLTIKFDKNSTKDVEVEPSGFEVFE